jgi:hypothetical protein
MPDQIEGEPKRNAALLLQRISGYGPKATSQLQIAIPGFEGKPAV